MERIWRGPSGTESILHVKPDSCLPTRPHIYSSSSASLDETLGTSLYSPPFHSTTLALNQSSPTWRVANLTLTSPNPLTGVLSHAGWRRQWSSALYSAAPRRTAPDRRLDLSGASPFRRCSGRSDPSGLDHHGPPESIPISLFPSPVYRRMSPTGTVVPVMGRRG